MNKKFFFCLMTAFFVKGSLFAILPPLYHTLAEFKAVVESPELTKSLQSGEAILSVTRDENTRFTVLTNKHKLLIDVVYEQTGRIGPAKFHLQFHEPVPVIQD
jgi:hypothetical protein